jgi:hypothetical protein
MPDTESEDSHMTHALSFPSETAELLASVFDLLRAIHAADPDLAAQLDQQAARLVIDVRERAIVVATVDAANGIGTPVVVVAADPVNRATFGDVEAPLVQFCGITH